MALLCRYLSCVSVCGLGVAFRLRYFVACYFMLGLWWVTRIGVGFKWLLIWVLMMLFVSGCFVSEVLGFGVLVVWFRGVCFNGVFVGVWGCIVIVTFSCLLVSVA